MLMEREGRVPGTSDNRGSVQNWAAAAAIGIVWLVFYVLLLGGALTGSKLYVRAVAPGALSGDLAWHRGLRGPGRRTRAPMTRLQ
jgi:hypothetical protein